jgi:glycyl-tRNA synthetase beta chain
MADFLLEIGLDEIPARMIAGAEAELGKRVKELLERERLLGGAGTVKTYSTPRRLAVLVEDVLAAQADTEEKLTGPPWKVAFKDGVPTAVAEAFAKKSGLDVAALEKVTNAKGEYVGATVKKLGRAAAELLAAQLPKEVLALYWAKNMYWRAGKPERFVRPVRWVVALLDEALVPVEIAGIKAGNASRGHRVLHGEKPVVIGAPKSYAGALRAAKVVVDVAERRQTIRKALDKATRNVAGARWREDEPLVETVTHLTEWPTVILGNFEAEYLALPEEVLVTVMRDHQKYFAVESADGKLAPHFLAVLNIEVGQEGYATIQHGNQKVLRARFKDARFFWDVDQKTPLVDRVESLKNVTFQKELGSYYWKTEQNLSVARSLASAVKARGVALDEAALLKAVELAKTDLTCELVKEFTELQGVIGGLYARAQGLGERVALAIYEQYTPAATDDEIPPSVEGQLLGLADRIQTITAMFGIGMAPTGSKDPFALRRAANAIVSILAESGLPLNLSDVIGASAGGEAGIVVSHPSGKDKDAARMGHPDGGEAGGLDSHPSGKDKDAARMGHPDGGEAGIVVSHPSGTNKDAARMGHPDGGEAGGLDSHPSGKDNDAARMGHPSDGAVREQVAAFLRERLHFFLKDVRGFAYDVVNAVLAAGADDVRDAIARAEALTEARASADFAAISAAFKRIKNILRQAEEKGFAIQAATGVGLAAEAQQLADAAAKLAPEVALLRDERNYGEALGAIATLRPVVDAFFDKVMVLDPDEKVRGAHLGLIASVLAGFSGIADFSEIVTG